jgi:hypothetical protein
MKFHSFEQLQKTHDVPVRSRIGQLLGSVAAAIAIFSGLLMLMPLAT